MIRCRHFKKALFGVSILSAACLLLTGCASFHRTIDFFRSWGEKESAQRLSEKDMHRFASEIRLHRGNPDSHYLLACYYQQRGRHVEAIKEFDKAVFIDPLHVKAHNGKGVSYDRLGQFQQAAEAYGAALKINPALDYVYNNLGYSFLLQENYDAAIGAFGKAVQLNGKSSRIRNNLGMAYAMKGEFHLALREFEQAGDRLAAHYLMARIHYDRGLFEKAKAQYAEALALNPEFTGARKGLEASEAMAGINRAAGARVVPDDARAVTTGENQKADALKAPSIREAGIEVSNGCGVNNAAREISGYLKDRGFNVVRLTNADHFNYVDGSIFCRKGYCDLAYELAMWFPGVQDIRETERLDRGRVKIKILIGKNQSRYRSLLLANRGS
ncbi:MAG TPA: tetratricopeptide repeat protein [Syntrophales bacterium]|nr:tetratricopeptide repeat protein [Syntrophales bacterium]HOX93690.1 tetratricopeptide repeat protein [Syntrophales bacterium]HPI56572.1 tetratricopeptide repeat protein [Syntrophales bacterium]HPN25007.1 tetratricopeptide repeat protein [Syntrophales bacterium]HQM29251.1 tetratricopeptide repeat protein [Syntrophales bacterium]